MTAFPTSSRLLHAYFFRRPRWSRILYRLPFAIDIGLLYAIFHCIDVTTLTEAAVYRVLSTEMYFQLATRVINRK